MMEQGYRNQINSYIDRMVNSGNNAQVSEIIDENIEDTSIVKYAISCILSRRGSLDKKSMNDIMSIYRNTKEIVELMVELDSDNLEIAHPEILDDVKFMSKIVKMIPNAREFAGYNVRKSVDFFVAENFEGFEYVGNKHTNPELLEKFGFENESMRKFVASQKSDLPFSTIRGVVSINPNYMYVFKNNGFSFAENSFEKAVRDGVENYFDSVSKSCKNEDEIKYVDDLREKASNEIKEQKKMARKDLEASFAD